MGNRAPIKNNQRPVPGLDLNNSVIDLKKIVKDIDDDCALLNACDDCKKPMQLELSFVVAAANNSQSIGRCCDCEKPMQLNSQGKYYSICHRCYYTCGHTEQLLCWAICNACGGGSISNCSCVIEPPHLANLNLSLEEIALYDANVEQYKNSRMHDQDKSYQIDDQDKDSQIHDQHQIRLDPNERRKIGVDEL